MIHLTIVSKCRRKALERTRHVLDNYGQRIGDKTWDVKISQTGYNNLLLNLKQIAKRNNSIGIYKDGEIITVIGNKNLFHKGISPLYIKKSQNETKKSLYLFMSLIGFLHDIGKANSYFQKVIRGEIEFQPIRHDLISMLMFEFLISNPISKCTSKNIDKYIKKRLKDKNIFVEGEVFESIETVIKLLLLSHHRLPEFTGKKLSQISMNKHIPGVMSKTERGGKKQIQGKLPGKLETLCLWSDLEVQKIKKRIDYAMGILKESVPANSKGDSCIRKEHNSSIGHNFKDINFETAMTLFFKGRFCLMNADYYVSSHQKFVIDEDMEDGVLYAKSIDYGLQRLWFHIKMVSASTKSISKKIDTIEFNNIPKNRVSDFQTPITIDKFMWQQKASDYFKEHYNRDNGAFIVIGASVGAGKTRFGARIASMLDDNMRVNIALGLRTLTLQTSRAYKEITKLHDSDIVTLIGSKEVLNLFNKNDDEAEEYTEDSSDIIIDYSEDSGIDIPEELQTLINTPSKRKMMSSPIVVSTIDYLIQAGDFRRSRHLASQFRVMSSNLLLDEVDEYGVDDLKSIMRLAFIIGFYGKKLILSTATAITPIIDYLYRMYSYGYRIYQKSNNIDNDIDFFYLSDKNNSYKNMTILENGNSIEKFYYDIIEDGFIDEEEGNRALIKDVNCEKSNNSDNIVQDIINLHNENYEITSDGRKISGGAIRIANIKNLYKVYKFIKDSVPSSGKSAIGYNSKDLEDTVIIPMVYHSNMFLIVRSFLEKVLDETFYRKDKKLEDTKLFKELLKKYSEKNIIFVLVASPVIEVGRDLDFDWGIVEPSSTRSISQFSGRIRRHRDKVNHVNMIIMNENFRFKENRNAPCYIFPGFEPRERQHWGNNKSFKNLTNSNDTIIITSRLALEKESTDFSQREHYEINKELDKYFKTFYNNSYSFLGGDIYKYNNGKGGNVYTDFRASHKGEDSVYIYKEDDIYICSDEFPCKDSLEGKKKTHKKELNRVPTKYQSDNILYLLGIDEYINDMKKRYNNIDEFHILYMSTKISVGGGKRELFYDKIMGILY